MIGYAKAEGPSAVVGLVILSGANKAMVVVALEMKHPVGSHAEREAKAASETCVETTVGTFNERVGIACEGSRVVGHVNIAMTPLRQPVPSVATEHEIDTACLTTNGEISHKGKLKVEVVISCGISVSDVGIKHIEAGVVIFGEQIETRTDSEPAIELITHTAFEIDAAAHIPYATPTGRLDFHTVTGASEEEPDIPTFSVGIENFLLRDKVLADIFVMILAASMLILMLGINLLIAKINSGGRLHSFYEVGVEERLVFVGVNEGMSHTTRTGLENDSILVERILRQHVGVIESNQCRYILSRAFILSHRTAHDSEQQSYSKDFLHFRYRFNLLLPINFGCKDTKI